MPNVIDVVAVISLVTGLVCLFRTAWTLPELPNQARKSRYSLTVLFVTAVIYLIAAGFLATWGLYRFHFLPQ